MYEKTVNRYGVYFLESIPRNMKFIKLALYDTTPIFNCGDVSMSACGLLNTRDRV